MDPTVCYELMLDADDAATAVGLAEDLIVWLDRGGFPPEGMTVAQARHAATDTIDRWRRSAR